MPVPIAPERKRRCSAPLSLAAPSKSEQKSNDGATRAWNGLIAVAGATAGIAALVYFVGAVTMWARFQAAKLPADIATEHQPRGEVVALGVRGVAVIGGLIIVAAACVYLLAIGLTYIVLWMKGAPAPDAQPSRTMGLATTISDQNVLDVSAKGVKRLRLGWFRFLGLLGVAVVIGTAFISWRALAIAIAGVALVAASLRYFYERQPGSTRPSLALIVFTLLAAGAAAVAWQIQSPVHVQTVQIQPKSGTGGGELRYVTDLGGVPFPYLGETSSYVYIAEVRRSTPAEKKSSGLDYQYIHRVLEVRRDAVRLAFPAEKGLLYGDVSSPASAFRHAVSSAWATLTAS